MSSITVRGAMETLISSNQTSITHKYSERGRKTDHYIIGEVLADASYVIVVMERGNLIFFPRVGTFSLYENSVSSA